MSIERSVLASVAWAVLLVRVGIGSAQEKQYQSVYGHGSHAITVATGSPGELGLLEALVTEFNRTHDTTVRWRKAGSGASLKLLKAKQVDVALVHAPEAERRALAEGWAAHRTLFGSNEFYIVGPKGDPAGISKASSAADAFARVARAKARFLSRGDDSGTHKKELAVWERAGIEPSGDWYIVTDDFMLATLKKANRVRGYFMTDSSTWVAAKRDLNNLAVLFQGDPVLVNVYHGLCLPQHAVPGEQRYAEQLLQFLTTKKAQDILRSFGVERHGEPMYRDAAYAARFDH